MQNRNFIRGLFALVFVSAVILSLSAEDSAGSANGGKGFYIADVTYNITGITWERILAEKIDFKIGKSFESQEDLDTYLDDQLQLLINQRVLAEADLKYTTTVNPDGRTAVHVAVYTRDTWNIIVLPYAKYDSNSGLLLSLRGRDFNFLGSMETLILDLDYTFTESSKNEYGQALEFKIPFQFVNHDWRIGIEESLTYNAEDNDYKFDFVTTLEVDFPIQTQDWTLAFSQGYYRDYEDSYGDTSYNQSKLSFGTDFELPLTLGHLGTVKYGPDVFFQVNYRTDRELSDDKRGYEPGFTHEIYVERIDWIGNFRDGGYLSLGNTISYNLSTTEWDKKITWEATGHKAFPWIGLSGRLSGFYQIDKELGEYPDDTVGEPIRGILDDRLKGDLGFFLNTDYLLKMWLWKLDAYFEVQVGPFFDMALMKRKDASVDFDDMWYGGGMQMIVFLKAARSLYLRASLGWDLEAVLDDHRLTGTAPRDGEQRYEMFIGLGHHY